MHPRKQRRREPEDQDVSQFPFSIGCVPKYACASRCFTIVTIVRFV